MSKPLDKKIIKLLYKAEGKPLTLSELQKFLGYAKEKRNTRRVKAVLEQLILDGSVKFTKGGYKLCGGANVFKGEITRVFRAHGYAKNLETNEEYFVPGRQLIGSVPGDTVLARITENTNDGRASTCRVLIILEETEKILTGIITNEFGAFHLLPDSFVSPPLPIISWGGNKIKNGDKVSFSLHERGERHSEHTVDIVSVYGSADNARVSVKAYLDEHNIPDTFSEEAFAEARYIEKQGISDSDFEYRLDLRDSIVFTIDGADTKDIDDAVSLEKTEAGYRLGVHIADVSRYVKKNSALDKDAFRRGTSVYIADLVIPMLPRELSNGICSLNPNEDRLAFSCLMDITENGKLDSFIFKKTIIRSRLQGVYSEINAIFDNTAEREITEKYAEVMPQLKQMLVLADILKKKRKERGAPEIISQESKIICDENGACTDIKLREGGLSENIIEEFMLAANNAAAKLAMEHEFPFVYRIHEAPGEEKLQNLSDALLLLGISSVNIKDAKNISAAFTQILEKAKGTDKEGVVNKLVLRAMMKAKYSPEPVGHFGLVMKEYAHFTSPIRRYPDLSIHRILSDVVSGTSLDKLYKKYGKFAAESSLRSSATELSAVNAERDCNKYYMAEYMRPRIGEEFDGVISGVTGSGIFIMLPNTVEGRIDALSLSAGGVYEAESNIALVEKVSGKRYTLGDKMRVRCEAVSVKAGLIDFVPV